MLLDENMLASATQTASCLIDGPYMPPLTRDRMGRQWFYDFCRVWSVGRTIRGGTRDNFYDTFWADLAPNLISIQRQDEASAVIARFAAENIGRFASKENSTIISAVSKLSAFTKPDIIAPVDKYAFNGLKTMLPEEGRRKLLGSRPNHATYINYNRMFFEGYNLHSDQIENHINRNRKLSSKIEKENKGIFALRCFDNYLMRLGGRFSPEKASG